MAENEKIGGLAALGAGGRRFESFCPDLKIKELQAVVAPFFGHFQKTGHEKDTLFIKTQKKPPRRGG